MSLLLVYRDAGRIVAGCDRRRIGASGEAVDDCEKFTIAGRFVIGSTGRCDLATRLRAGAARLLAAHPVMTFSDLAEVVRISAVRMFAARSPVPAETQGLDILCALLSGWDSDARRMRTIIWDSRDSFAPVEGSTRNLCVLGVHSNAVYGELQRIAPRLAKSPALPDVARLLRTAIRNIAQDEPLVSSAAYFAAVDRDRQVELPGEFAPVPEMAAAAAPGYFATLSKETALQGGDRYFVGSIRTPVDGGEDTAGNDDGGAGAQSGVLSRLRPATISNITETGATSTEEEKAIDGLATSFALLHVTGDGTFRVASFDAENFPGITRQSSKMTLKVRYSVPNNSTSGTPGTYIVGGIVAKSGNNVYGAFDLALLEIVNGQTAGEGTLSLALAAQTNPAKVVLRCRVGGGSLPSGDHVDLRVFDVRLEVEE